MRKVSGIVVLLCLCLAQSGCASRIRESISPEMKKIGLGATAAKPDAGRSTVVFMRPTTPGYAIQSSVFELMENNDDHMVGIVSAFARVAYVTTPGKHLFMVIGENADFMTADLAAGKTYYVLVTPRMGWVKARFSLEPVRRAQIASSEFAEWQRETVLVENTSESYQWAKQHWPSIQDKKTDYLRKWNSRSESERMSLGLQPDDGVD